MPHNETNDFMPLNHHPIKQNPPNKTNNKNLRQKKGKEKYLTKIFPPPLSFESGIRLHLKPMRG